MFHVQKAARLGVLPAIYNIGNYYSAGIGGAEKSDARAYQYYYAGAQVTPQLSWLATSVLEYAVNALILRDLSSDGSCNI